MATRLRNIAPELLTRQSAAWQAISQLKLDSMILTHDSDLAWLTGFTGEDSVGILTARKVVLVTDFRFTEQAFIEAPWMKAILRKGRMSEALAKQLASAKVRKVGFETNFTEYGTIDALRKELKKLKADVELVPLSDVLVNVRATKDRAEVSIIREAIKCAQDAFVALKKSIKPGATENDLAARLVYEMRKRGASGSSFPPIIGSGAPSSIPHYRPQDKEIQNNTFLLIDWGAYYKGYCSDITRTLLVGKVSPKLKEIYKVTLEANQKAIEAIRPGITNKAVDKIARDHIAKAGYGKYFGHGLGHGIGKDIHEAPRLSHMAAEEPLKPGMVVTVEPGIYLPGEGGVRIEDDVLVTDSGHEVLTSLDKSLEGNTITL